MIQRFAPLIIYLALSINGFSQTSTLLAEGIENELEVKFNFDTENASNEIIGIVAKAKALPEHAVSLKYTVKEHRQIIKNTNKLQLQLSVGNFVFNDDVAYQKFNISKFLHPTQISYTYVFADANDNVIETKIVKDGKFKNGSYLLKKSVDNPNQSDTYQLYLSELSLGFSSSDVEKLNGFVAAVDGYYNADARLNMLEKELDKIITDSIEMLESYRQITIDNIKVLNQIRSERYTSKLRLDSHDPIQFKSHFGRVEVRNRTLKKELERTLDNMHITYYKKGIDWLNRGDEAKAKLNFEKSIIEKSSYTPPMYELANLNYNNGMLQQAVDSCAAILNKFKPDNDTRYNAVKLSEAVISKYIDEINLMVENRQFAEAVDKLRICENYSKNIPGVKYFAEYDEIQGKLYKAYYLDLVELTEVDIDQKRLDKAQLNIDSLDRFRKAHTQHILNPEKEHQLLKLLYDGWMEAGKSFRDSQIPDSTLYAFTQANIICHKYEVIYCTEELQELISQARVGQYNYMVMQASSLIDEQLADSAITLLNNAETFRMNNSLNKNQFVNTLLLKAKQIKYAELIVAGEKAYGNKKAREALAFYDEAKSLEKEYEIAIDSSLRTKIVYAAQSYISALCIQGETLVEALHVGEANQKLNAAKNLYKYYVLNDDDISTQAIESLQEKLKEGKCNQVSYNYNIQVIAAQKFIDQQEFIYAWKALEKAKRIEGNNTECTLVDSIQKRLAKEVKPMYYYEKKTDEIEILLDEGSYAEIIEEYDELTTFYADSIKLNYGIQHKNLFKYITTHKVKGIMDYAVRYYAEQGNIDTALIILYELHDRDYISSWSKESQIMLGKQLALADLETEGDIDPKVKVIDYTKADKWYNHLKKAYLTEWKNR